MDKDCYKTLAKLTFPLAMQNLVTYGASLVSSVLLGKLGETAMSAVSLAGQVYFIFNVICLGIASGASVLVSQYWGKKNQLEIQKIMSMSIQLVLLFAIPFTGIVFCFPKEIMSIFSKEQEVIVAGAAYLRIVCLTYTLGGISGGALMIARGVKSVNISFITYTASFLTSIVVSYLCIFGKWGIPQMGVAGAAFGLVASRLCEFGMILLYFAMDKKIKFRFSMLLLRDKQLLWDMVKVGSPVAISEAIWAFGISIHSVLLGHLGKTYVAADNIGNGLFHLVLSFIMGTGGATAVMVGNMIGEKGKKEVYLRLPALKKAYTVLGILSAVIMFLLMEPIISLYEIDPATREVARQMIVIYAICILAVAYTNPFITGIFRGSGDTRFAMIADTGCLWFFIPIAAIALWLGVPNSVVFLILKLQYFAKATACLLRARGTKWVHVVTREKSHSMS